VPLPLVLPLPLELPPMLPLPPAPDEPLLPELPPLEPGLVELPAPLPLGLLGLEGEEDGLLDDPAAEPEPLAPPLLLLPASSRWQAATLKPTAVARIKAVKVDCLRMMMLLI
jgi:hypothetical protein